MSHNLRLGAPSPAYEFTRCIGATVANYVIGYRERSRGAKALAMLSQIRKRDNLYDGKKSLLWRLFLGGFYTYVMRGSYEVFV